MSVSIDVDPVDALVDDPLHVRVVGLSSRQKITIEARADHEGEKWRSSATFRAGDYGVVDLYRDAPSRGSYRGTEHTGLLWSLDAGPEMRGRIAGNDPHAPWTITLSAIVGDDCVTAANVVRRFASPDVSVEIVRDGPVRGLLYVPAAPPPLPTVISLTGSDGGLHGDEAALLASRGFASLALAYFRYDDLPEHAVEVPLEYFERAIRFLRHHPRVRADRVGVIGTSMGGELSLLLGATFSEVTAVVSRNGSGVVTRMVDADGTSRSFASIGGKPLPFYGPGDPPEQWAAAAIAVERIVGGVLLISGGDDQIWPSKNLHAEVFAKLRGAGFGQRVEHLVYEEAGHAIGMPNVPYTRKRFEWPNGFHMALGGTPRANAHASADSWPRTLTFLRSHLSC